MLVIFSYSSSLGPGVSSESLMCMPIIYLRSVIAYDIAVLAISTLRLPFDWSTLLCSSSIYPAGDMLDSLHDDKENNVPIRYLN